jgi:hypothetical protein
LVRHFTEAESLHQWVGNFTCSIASIGKNYLSRYFHGLLYSARLAFASRAIESQLERFKLKVDYPSVAYSNREGPASGFIEEGFYIVPGVRQVDSWPSIDIAAGVNQPLGHLRRHMEWWFETSRHSVKIVILCKVSLELRELRVEKWIEHTERDWGVVKPVLEQEIRMYECYRLNAKTGQSDEYHDAVGRLPFVLEFAQLYERLPVEDEADLELQRCFFESLAQGICSRY